MRFVTMPKDKLERAKDTIELFAGRSLYQRLFNCSIKRIDSKSIDEILNA